MNILISLTEAEYRVMRWHLGDATHLEPRDIAQYRKDLEGLKKKLDTCFDDKNRYQDFIKRYWDFRLASGVEPRLDAAQGKAMKAIMAYLKSISSTKDVEGALNGWDFILSNWVLLSDFLKNQVTLVQINKNMEEILSQIKNARTSKKNGELIASAEREQLRNSLKG